jgi:hypothetical protein
MAVECRCGMCDCVCNHCVAGDGAGDCWVLMGDVCAVTVLLGAVWVTVVTVTVLLLTTVDADCCWQLLLRIAAASSDCGLRLLVIGLQLLVDSVTRGGH